MSFYPLCMAEVTGLGSDQVVCVVSTHARTVPPCKCKRRQALFICSLQLATQTLLFACTCSLNSFLSPSGEILKCRPPQQKPKHPKVQFRAIESRSGAADKSSQSPSSKVVCEVVKAR